MVHPVVRSRLSHKLQRQFHISRKHVCRAKQNSLEHLGIHSCSEDQFIWFDNMQWVVIAALCMYKLDHLDEICWNMLKNVWTSPRTTANHEFCKFDYLAKAVLGSFKVNNNRLLSGQLNLVKLWSPARGLSPTTPKRHCSQTPTAKRSWAPLTKMSVSWSRLTWFSAARIDVRTDSGWIYDGFDGATEL